MTSRQDSQWERARLIPVSGIGSPKEQERRACSALLAVLHAVREFGIALTAPLGAPRTQLNTYAEVEFKLSNDKKTRPDGVIHAERGKKRWRALVEVKTGETPLDRTQIETYLDLARDLGYDCVLTISNEIAHIPGRHPVEVDKRKTRSVALHHLSWSRILTEAILQKSYRGVKDPEQAWILEELIRYLEHDRAGAADFGDMGPNWVAVRNAVRQGTLRPNDAKAEEIACKWEELASFCALRFCRRLGADVRQVLTGSERKNFERRLRGLTERLVSDGTLDAVLRVPNAAGDISILADLRGRRIRLGMTLDAPKTGRSRTRVNWLLRQLEAAPQDLVLESWGLRARASQSDSLERVRETPDLLVPGDGRELRAFTVGIGRRMGGKRSGAGSFSGSVLSVLDEFYTSVVENIRPWQEPVPKYKPKGQQKQRTEEAELNAELESATKPGPAESQTASDPRAEPSS